MKSLSFLLTAVVGVSATAVGGLKQRASNWTVGQTVQTANGPVAGHPASNQSDVSEYLGIPFAQPPIGDLRFAAPVKPTGNSSYNGTDFGPSCPVKLSNSTALNTTLLLAANVTEIALEIETIFGDQRGLYSEDCLYINVWTKPQTGDAMKAVLVWIYGGGFNSGASSYAGYNGANIVAQEDVIVVSFNYRLSILGFPGSPATTNNLAFLDQRLAVEWVRDNIANFGGDPSRITLFGQSAGAFSVDAYSYAWTSDPIAAGFISESGTVFSWGLPDTKAEAAAAWYNVSAAVGCGNSSSDAATVLACMRSTSYTTIMNAIPPANGVQSEILGYFGPTVDETVVFSNYSSKTPAKVPMIIGNNDYEGGLFRTEFAVEGEIFPDIFWDDFNLQEFTCPAGIRANASVSASNPTWRYRYFGVFPDTAISSEAGAYHSAELPILFDTAPSSPPATTEEIAIGNYMRGAWAAFAKDPVNGLTTYGWPSYSASNDSLIRLAYNNLTGTNAVNPSVYDANCIYVNVSNVDPNAYTAILGPSTTATSSGSSKPTGSATTTSSVATASSKFFQCQLKTAEENGDDSNSIRTLYIDRDPVTFKDISLHLQGYHVQPRDGGHFVKLFADAQFYSLPRLISQLYEENIFISIGNRDFQVPKDIFSDPGNSPNYFSLGFAVFFSSPTEVFPGLNRDGLLRPPSIVPPSVPNRSADIFQEILHLLRGYPLHIRNEDHRAELLRDVRYFHLKGLEQKLIRHSITYNLARRKDEITLRIEDVRQSGISIVSDPTPTPSSPAPPTSATEMHSGSSIPPNPVGYVHYARPFVDTKAYELVLEIGNECTKLHFQPPNHSPSPRSSHPSYPPLPLPTSTSPLHHILFPPLFSKSNNNKSRIHRRLQNTYKSPLRSHRHETQTTYNATARITDEERGREFSARESREYAA
ncbi:hypothetical protein G7Y89_g15443 [Cudoniella acicularis]|uniref:Carboxylesterase type B domain-containing protein n=1 Tax=Cudoniella acicularis TaxID=354080 RepID=A0A8H4VNH6_9HELO|nr:hypothetical protein G7Y89_g15443 [Cudoniella acicularis]